MRAGLKRISPWIIGIIALILLAGCGGRDKDSFSIFIMDKGDASVIRDELAQKLKDKLGEQAPTIEISVSPLYNQQKLVVEYAAGEHDLFLLPEEDMKLYGQNGSNLPLDDAFDKKTYARGVFEGGVFKKKEQEEEGTDVIKETHLFGIPVEQMKMFKDLKYNSNTLFATVPPRTSNKEEAIKVLKALTE
ncbi:MULTISPECIES: hypothetical protein [Paenibacillus]|uniref:hypothetical protein n=1 Tax=Paenibacillus TaxID=44249 RepID=UPI000737B4E0|nr:MULTISPECIES: hypothetical protein [Paenibacillus]KAF6564675.1 hypothetical protein G9G63_11120 [Paenibacillus sp. EKM202P]KAF6571510.1 hypothetical protein G9G64_05655 [Paenibacillus sp. EKM207P]